MSKVILCVILRIASVVEILPIVERQLKRDFDSKFLNFNLSRTLGSNNNGINIQYFTIIDKQITLH